MGDNIVLGLVERTDSMEMKMLFLDHVPSSGRQC